MFGIPEIPRYDLAGADTVVSFGADILDTWMSPVEMTGQFARMRGADGKNRSRLVHVGPSLSLTASNADLWLNVAPDAMDTLALSLVNVVLRERGAVASRDEAARIGQMVDRFAPCGGGIRHWYDG